MNCQTSLFSEVHAGGLTPKIAPIIKKNRDKSPQEVYKLIVEMLNNQESFLFGGENSGARYNASIASLREAILALAEPIANKFMGPDSYTQLKRLFEDNFLADAGIASGSVKNDTDPETPYMENNPDMMNEDERVKQKLDSIVETYYGTVVKANNFRKQQFGLDLVKAAIIDTDQKIIVRSNADLNKALCLLKNRYLGNIVAYLQSIDPNFSADSRVFGDNFRKLPGYEQTLNRFYNELKARKEEGSVEDLITEGWKRRLSGQSDLFYDALNSYVNLVYFDDILEDTIGRVIQLSNTGYSGIELDAQFGKYKFSKGDEHKRKGFQNSENRNALNDIAKFSRLVLSTIPVYSAIDGKFLNRYVNVGNFANAITSLFTHAHLLGNNYLALQEAVTKFHSNPYYYSEIIFKELSKTNIQQALINTGVNRFNINILTSVFKHVFDTNNPSSIKSIETASLKKQFSIDGYSIIDSINGVIDRTMDATYLQMVYSGDTGMIEVSPKKKFTDRKVSYNIVNKINATNSSRPQEVRKKLSTRFPVTKADLTSKEREFDSSCMTFSVSIGQNAITGVSKSKMGILDVTPIDIKFSNPRMAQIFDPSNTTIDLISKQSVDRIVSGSNLSPDEKLFRDTLEFVDAFLGTKLLSVDGLNKLYLYKVTNTSAENYISEILESAIRSAVVNDLYLKFNDDLAAGKYQSILNFEGFLKAEYTPFGNIDFNNIEETRNFFANKLGVPDLISVRTSEDWIDQMADVEAIITGEVSKSVTSDINGNKIANNRTSFLGGNLQYYLSKYKEAGPDTATSPLLFTRDSSLVVKTVFNTDAESRLGIKKSVKDMKAAELFYSSIIYNFYGSYLQADFNSKKFGRGKSELYRTLLTQPTTFSDKISFVMYAINAGKALQAEGKSYNGKTVWQLNTEETIDLYQDTIGAAYVNLFNNVLDDLRTVLEMPNATFEQINQVLNNTTQEQLLSQAQAKGVELQLDTHYRKFGKVCKFNELLYHYATDLYVNRDTLKRRFEIEKVNFINDLLTSGVSFYTNYSDDSDDVLRGKKGQHTSNPVSKIIEQLYKEGEERENYKNIWVKNKKLVLARVNGQPIVNGAEIAPKPGDTVELNPILEKYFFTDSLLANNLRFELTGSEIAHPDKAKIDYSDEVKKRGITPETNPEYFQYDKDGNVVVKEKSGVSVPQVISNFSDLVWLKNQSILHPALKQIFDNAILKVEAVAQGTQLKRNVIIPATLQYEQQNTLNGIPARMKVAVISDTGASVFNFRGDNTGVDAHDGSAYINPFVSILENKALQDQEVGVDKKPIWHSYNPRLMSATLLKFATFTMTNERMRTSLNSNISLYNLFKQMTNIQWSTVNPDGTTTWNNSRNAEFNLIDTKGFRKNQFDKINFFTDIIANKPLFYEENGKHYQILDFGMDEKGYYTIEAEVNLLGDRRDSEHDIKVYHAFNENSEHFKFRDAEPTAGLHTINSLYELFNAMGGIYSEELVEDEEGKKQLQYTDAASFAVVNFMNNISIRVGNNTEDLSQNTYYQPLKEMMIAYAANKSAVKNGIANINSSEAWLGNTALRYMEIDSDGLGIQMDADHEIDESEMTEFSQVISALEAGGRLHHMSKQVYRTLGELAVKASQAEIDTAVRYIKAKNAGLPTDKIRSELYDILGRALINNYKQDENRTDLAAPVIAEIKKKFNLSEDHSLDEFKIPFSDSNLYGQTISTFVSNINSKSIKRKYPGSGCVMVPGYDIIQTYKYNGKIKQFDDVLKEARAANFGQKFFRDFNPQAESIQSYNKSLVQAYLGTIQAAEWAKATPSVEEFIPTDIVDVLINGQYLTTIDLNDIGTYYTFKDDTKRLGYIADKTGANLVGANLTYSINVTSPRNLAPARIRWKYTDTNGVTHTKNIFDAKPIRDAFYYEFSKKHPEYRLLISPDFNPKTNRRLIQKIFDDLDKGTYEGYQIFDLENEAAELVISNMYASKFNTKGKSLAEILDRGPNFFRIGKIKPIHSSHYEMAFTTNNGRHTYISFKTPKVDENSAFKPKNVGWKYTKTVTKDGQENVYATTKDGQILFKVGQNILRNGVDYINGQFIDKETGEPIVNNNLRINSRGQVVEYKEFVSNFKVTELGQNGRPVTYDLYSINSQNIGDAQHNSTRESVNGQIASILSKVYDASSYNGIRLNYRMSGSSALRISEVLPKMRADGSLKEFMDLTLSKYLVNIDPEKTFSINKTDYDSDLKNFYNQMSGEIYASFEKSLTFTASRIPAQTLQSFMQMRAVGLTQSSKNIAYVSHWQTYLQGSDYDIDKAYIMGYEFDDNGRYVGWSNLFDYSSIDGLRASEYLPIPDEVVYEKRDNGFDISEQITNIASKATKAEKIRAYADLLVQLQDVGYKWEKGKKYTYVTWNDTVPTEVAEQVLSDINLHSQTYLSPQKIEKCLKNSVSSSITNIIQNLRNMDQAYSPIEMETVRDASKGSPKGNKSDRMTLLNPLTKFLMQEQNMVGKGVIGITAVGEKVFFNVSHYWNEGIRSGNERWIKSLQFSQTFGRIQGRSKDPKGLGSLTSIKKTTLANVNFESVEEMRLRFEQLSAVDEQLRQKYLITDADIEQQTDRWKLYRDELIQVARSRQDSDVYADDIISQLLSAATDNAKELILSKINAGTNLARCYLHLIMMGFDISDIAAFMISPVVSIVNDLSTANMFDEYMFKVSIDDAIKILRGDFPLTKFFYGRMEFNGENMELSKVAYTRVKNSLQNKLQSLGFTMKKKTKVDGKSIEVEVPKIYKNMKEIISDYWKARVTGMLDQPLTDFVSNIQANTRLNNNIIAFSDYIDNVVSKVKNSGLDQTQFYLDLDEFSKVYDLASETSTLGSTLLGLNQGIPTSKEDLLNKVFKIQQAVSTREKVFGINPKNLEKEEGRNAVMQAILNNNEFLNPEEVQEAFSRAEELGIVNNFDFYKWLEDNNGYRRATSDYYNLIKGTWNIFDIVDRLPHFNAIFQAFQAILTTDEVNIKKSYILNKMCADLFGNADYIDAKTISGLLDYVDDLLILRWLNRQAFRFPVFEGDTVFKFNWKSELHKGGPSSIIIDEESSRGTFKKLIEERLFPHLQEGFYYDVDENGNQVRKEIDKNNKFLQTLVLDINNQGQRYLKLDLDMQNTSATPNNEGRYQECLSDFIKLKNSKLGGRPLTDWIMIYNLLVNKNKFGSDRLTTLFGQFIGMIKEESVIGSIMRETGELDFSEVDVPQSVEDLVEWGYNRDDALYKIAPIISKAQEANSTAALVKEFKDGRIVVKRRVYQNYSDSEEIIPKSTDLILDENEAKVDLLTRFQNYMNYGVIQTPFANKRSSNITNLSSNETELVLSALQNYIKQGIIDIYTENC